MTAGSSLPGSDKYEILNPIGRGGMGEVYLARDIRLKRQVAIKFLRADLVQTEGWRAHAGREAQLLAKLNHPNIVQIYDIIEQDEAPALVMEFVDGRNLYIQLREQRADLSERLRWLNEIADGLAAAHAAGIVHNDLKAENVLIGSDGVAKVTDFGIADPESDQRNDLLALGKLAQSLLEDEPNLSPALVTLLQSLQSRRPKRRPSAREAQLGFRHAWLESTQDETPLPEQPQGSKISLNKSWLVGAAVGLVVLIGAAAGLLSGNNTPSLYVAILPTTISSTVEKTDPEHEALRSSVQHTLRQSVIETPSMALVGSQGGVDEQGTLSEIANALGADELVMSNLQCSRNTCELLIERLGGPNLSVISQRTTTINVGLALESYNIVQRQWQYLYPSDTIFQDPENLISEEDYSSFLQLHSLAHVSGADHKTILKQLEELMTRADRFLPLYILYSHSALDFYHEDGEIKYLDDLAVILKKASFWSEGSIPLSQSWFSLALEKGDYDKAEQELGHISNIGADEALLQTMTADRYRHMGRYSQADQHYKKAISLRPSRILYMKLASNYRDAGQLDQAVDVYQEITTLFGDDEIALELGLIQLENGDVDDAISTLSKGLAAQESPFYRNNLGLAYMLKADYERAHAEFTKAYLDGSRNPVMLLNLADTEALLENFSKAESLYKELVNLAETEGQQVELWVLSQAYAQLGQYGQAIATLKSMKKEGAESAFNAALVYTLAGQHIAAVVEVERALNGDFGPIWFTLPWFDRLCVEQEFAQIMTKAGYSMRCNE